MTVALDPGFRDYLLGIADVSERDLDKLVEELMDHWSETVEAWVRRRHGELQRQGMPNRLVYGTIAREAGTRPFASRPLSERQVRRIVYG
ncbi:MAG: hypothetical protein GY898_33740 [Proteobacteria bacterium]|nr:hypothetical protein [Pseudomonadota bacterium]